VRARIVQRGWRRALPQADTAAHLVGRDVEPVSAVMVEPRVKPSGAAIFNTQFLFKIYNLWYSFSVGQIEIGKA
jgi:hypothetical protein